MVILSNAQKTKRDGMARKNLNKAPASKSSKLPVWNKAPASTSSKLPAWLSNFLTQESNQGKKYKGIGLETETQAVQDPKVDILGLKISKSIVYFNIYAISFFIILVLSFMFFIRTVQIVEISETSYPNTANFALRNGDIYRYQVNSTSENTVIEFAITDRNGCKAIDMASYGQNLMSFCLDYNGKTVISNMPKAQQENRILVSLANSSLGMPNLPIKPWMLGLGSGFHYQANMTYISKTEGIFESAGIIGMESFEVIYLGTETHFGREAFKVLIRSSSPGSNSESTLWIDSQKRVILEMTSPVESSKLISAPFELQKN